MEMGNRTVARPVLDIALPGSALEAFAGRLLASCVHPWLAWRISSPAGRALIVLTYSVAAFLTTYGVLLVWSPAASL